MAACVQFGLPTWECVCLQSGLAPGIEKTMSCILLPRSGLPASARTVGSSVGALRHPD